MRITCLSNPPSRRSPAPRNSNSAWKGGHGQATPLPPGPASLRHRREKPAQSGVHRQVEDREPTLGFRGATYTLPKTDGQHLPLTSVNLDAARLRVLRINDRNLLREIENRRITNLLDGYDPTPSPSNPASRCGKEP